MVTMTTVKQFKELGSTAAQATDWLILELVTHQKAMVTMTTVMQFKKLRSTAAHSTDYEYAGDLE